MTVKPNPLAQRRATVEAAPLRKQVIALLRQAIFDFDYQPGERLVERDLCERLGVSRTVVREALRHLEAEGLVDLLPNRGPIVFAITYEDARALYEVREALEGLAAELCALRSSPSCRKQLGTALKRIEAAYQGKNLAEEVAAKDDFYTILFGGCGNPIVGSTLQSLNARAHMLRGLSLQAPGRTEESLTELRKLVDAIVARDGEAARLIGAEHVRNAGRVALARLAEVTEQLAAVP